MSISYTPGLPAAGTAFYGRTAERERILRSTRWNWICGPRRIGKSSLLRRLTEDLNRDGSVGLQLDFGIYDGQTPTGAKLLRDFTRDMANRKRIEAQGVALKEISGSDPAASLALLVEKLLERGCRKVVFLWDEAEGLADILEGDPGLLSRIAARLLPIEHFQFVIASNQRLTKLHTQAPDFFDAFLWSPLAGIEPVAARQLLRCENTGGWRTPISDEALDHATQWCGGHPFVLQHVGSTLSELGQGDDGQRLNATAVRQAQLQLSRLGTIQNIIRNDFEMLTPEQQRVLRQVCQFPQPLPLATLEGSASLPEPRLRSALGFLQSYGYVDAADSVELRFRFYRELLTDLEPTSEASAISVDRLRRTVFISYSHLDQRNAEDLQRALNPLLRGREVEVWSDSRIQPGDVWRREIDEALARAQVAVLLISLNFLNSKFINDHEIPPLLQKARQGGCRLLCLHVGPSNYDKVCWSVDGQPIGLDTFQHLNDARRSLKEMSKPERERALSETAVRIIESLHGGG